MSTPVNSYCSVIDDFHEGRFRNAIGKAPDKDSQSCVIDAISNGFRSQNFSEDTKKVVIACNINPTNELNNQNYTAEDLIDKGTCSSLQKGMQLLDNKRLRIKAVMDGCEKTLRSYKDQKELFIENIYRFFSNLQCSKKQINSLKGTFIPVFKRTARDYCALLNNHIGGRLVEVSFLEAFNNAKRTESQLCNKANSDGN